MLRGILSRGMAVSFVALEHRSDGGFARARFRFAGSVEEGWQVERNDRPHLLLGPGYSCLSVRACGVCATDLARRFLPFPLPQIIGHELLARDDAGRRCAVEINASCRARGQPLCARCRAGLDHHCPERRVLGIHDLPGGFGPWVLAPVHAIVPVPDGLPDDTAVLIEPFAAALHGVRRTELRDGDRVAVLGPRRLGMLVIAALAAERRRTGRDLEIVGVVRRRELSDLARDLGADELHVLDRGGRLPEGFAEVVFDTTGTPEGLACALPAATREVHLKSTHGRPAAGLRHLTEAVVDELRFAPLAASPPKQGSVWLGPLAAPDGARTGSAAELFAQLGPGGAEAVVVADGGQADAAIRPEPGREVSLLRPCGTLLVHPSAADDASSLLRHVARRGLVLGTSRCGDFRAALDLLVADGELPGLGSRLVTHRFGPDALAEAFAVAASPSARKVLVEHGPD
jgi:threonine dehydrogenase-like Zn-dependent dehydrogenase